MLFGPRDMLVLAAKGNQETLLLKGERSDAIRSVLRCSFTELLKTHATFYLQIQNKPRVIFTLTIAKFVFPVCLVPQKVFSFLLFPMKAEQAPCISTCSWRTPYGTQPKPESGPNMKPFASEGNSCSCQIFDLYKGA